MEVKHHTADEINDRYKHIQALKKVASLARPEYRAACRTIQDPELLAEVKAMRAEFRAWLLEDGE